jgi:hypothetical protein
VYDPFWNGQLGCPEKIHTSSTEEIPAVGKARFLIMVRSVLGHLKGN